MFQTKLLKSGLMAAAFLEAFTQAKITSADLRDFPDFAAAMQAGGAGYQWQSYPVTTADGYELTMMRITADAADVPLTGAKGPVLLTHGMYSELLTWLMRSDETAPATPIQLADLGFDVWFGVSRGRTYSRSHSTLDLTIQEQLETFMNYSFEEVGREDYPAMIDNIIASRPGQCDKVTLVTHSTGANAALIAALTDPDFDSKVARIVSLAPCLIASDQTFWINERDIESIQMLYNLLSSYGITSLFGPNHLEQIQPFCDASDLNNMICQAYLMPPVANVHLRENSLRYFQHVHQNLARTRFQEYVETTTTGSDTTLYNLPGVNAQTFAVFGTADTYCPPDLNAAAMSTIPNLTQESVFDLAHVDLLTENTTALTQIIANCLPDAITPVNPTDLCPVVAPTREKKSKGGDSSDSDSDDDDEGQRQADGGSSDSDDDTPKKNKKSARSSLDAQGEEDASREADGGSSDSDSDSDSDDDEVAAQVVRSAEDDEEDDNGSSDEDSDSDSDSD